MPRTVSDEERLSVRIMAAFNPADGKRIRDIASRKGTTPGELVRKCTLEGLGAITSGHRCAREEKGGRT